LKRGLDPIRIEAKLDSILNILYQRLNLRQDDHDIISKNPTALIVGLWDTPSMQYMEWLWARHAKTWEKDRKTG
jgi:hypothetical protein